MVVSHLDATHISRWIEHHVYGRNSALAAPTRRPMTYSTVRDPCRPATIEPAAGINFPRVAWISSKSSLAIFARSASAFFSPDIGGRFLLQRPLNQTQPRMHQTAEAPWPSHRHPRSCAPAPRRCRQQPPAGSTSAPPAPSRGSASAVPPLRPRPDSQPASPRVRSAVLPR